MDAFPQGHSASPPGNRALLALKVPRAHSPFPRPAALSPPGPPPGVPRAGTTFSPAHASPRSDLRVPLPRGRGQAALLRTASIAPAGPLPSRERGARPERRGRTPDPARRQGMPGAHHCAPRWSVVLSKAPSSDFWVSASGRSPEPPPSAISSAAPAQPTRTSASRTACCGPRPLARARAHARSSSPGAAAWSAGPPRLVSPPPRAGLSRACAVGQGGAGSGDARRGRSGHFLPPWCPLRGVSSLLSLSSPATSESGCGAHDPSAGGGHWEDVMAG